MDIQVKGLSWKWDPGSHQLWASVLLRDGRSFSVGFPVGHVTATFEESLGDVGIVLPPEVGAFDSVDGLGRMFKRARRKLGRAIHKVAASTTGKLADQAIHVVKQAARSKALGAALGGAAMVFPAVGGPALAAYVVANRAVSVADKYERAARRVARGLHNARDLVHLEDGKRIGRKLRVLARDPRPAARLLVAATKSVHR